MRKTICAIAFLSLLGSLHAADPGGGGLNGTWALNPAKSKFHPGPPYKSNTRTYEITGDAVKFSSAVVDAEGKSRLVEYNGKMDGREYLMTGLENGVNTVSINRVDAFTTTTAQKKNGRAVGTERATVSQDGKVMTLKANGLNAAGKAVKDILVYDKQ